MCAVFRKVSEQNFDWQVVDVVLDLELPTETLLFKLSSVESVEAAIKKTQQTVHLNPVCAISVIQPGGVI